MTLIYHTIIELLTKGFRDGNRGIYLGLLALVRFDEGINLYAGVGHEIAFVPKETVLHTAILKAW